MSPDELSARQTNLAPPAADDTRPGQFSGDTSQLTPPTVLGPIADPPPTASVAGYEIVGELGKGGMGVVYRAVHKELGRPVALKMVRGEGAADSPEGLRFLAEAAAVAAVSHPHVVAVFEYGRSGDQPFMVLELCGGGTFSQRLKAAGRMDPKTAAEVMAKIAEGVGAAHAAGIVHRDLKPGNVLFDDKGEPKVSDFGLAKRGAGTDLTQTNAVMGTPAYMSPEQARGQTKFVGPPADVWALGVMLYECLTGQRPFAAHSQMDLLQQVIYADPPTVRSVVKALPKDLDQIVRKCLSKVPHERYATAKELAADLHNWLEGKPVTARPPGPVVRAAKWVRRNPLPTALIAALAAVVVAVGVGAYFSTQQLERANQEQAGRLTAEEQKRAEEQARRVGEVQAAMRLAMQRGAAKEAVAAFDRMTADGLTPSAEMRLDRAKASYFLGELDEAVNRLAEVERDQLPGERRGEAELLDGLLSLGVDDARGEASIRAALVTGLPPADARFAEGMVADSTVKALAKFREAFKADPTHVESRVLAAAALAILSRYDEALTLIEQTRPLAPDHPFLPIIQLVVTGLNGDRVKVEELMADCRTRYRDPKMLATLESTAQLAAFIPEVRKMLSASAYGGEVNWVNLMKELGPTGKVGRQAGNVLDRSKLPTRSYSGFPPCFRRDVEFFFAEVIASMQGEGVAGSLMAGMFRQWFPHFKTDGAVFTFTDAAGAAKARARLAEFPEGTLRVYYAVRLLELANTEENKSGWGPTARDAFVAAAAAYEEAAATPGVLVEPGFVYESAARCYALSNRAIGGVRGPGAISRKAGEMILARLRTNPPPRTEPQFRALYDIAAVAGDQTSAMTVLDQWQKALDKPTPEYVYCRANLFTRLEAYGNGLWWAEYGLAMKLNDADRKALVVIRDRCRRELKMPELLPPPRKAE